VIFSRTAADGRYSEVGLPPGENRGFGAQNRTICRKIGGFLGIPPEKSTKSPDKGLDSLTFQPIRT
jgi:hypothetical protein